MSTWEHSGARVAGACIAVGAIGGLLALSVLTEQALGRIEGRVYMANMKPVGNASIALISSGFQEESRHSRTTRTRADGSFLLTGVRAGSYSIIASSRAHGILGPTVEVEEGRTTPLALRLQRNRDPFSCSASSSSYRTSEPVSLAASGYLDDRPAVRTLSVELRSVAIAPLLAEPGGFGAYREAFKSWWSGKTSLLVARHSSFVRTVVRRLGDGDAEGFFDERVALGRLPAGAYTLVARYGSRSSTTPIVVTDMGVVVRASSTEAYAMVTDLVTGHPRTGASVRFYRFGRLAAQADTGTDGLASLRDAAGDQSVTEPGDSGAIACFGRDYACAVGYDYRYDNSPFRVFGYTDRPIYRPGQEVRFKAIARRIVADGPRYSVPVGETIRIRAEDPDGIVLARSVLTTGRFGSVSGSFRLSPETRAGDGVIFVETGSRRDVIGFTVASYRKPELALTVKPRRPYYVSGDRVEFDVGAQYYYGAPVGGGLVTYSTSWGPDWEWESSEGEGRSYEYNRDGPRYGDLDVTARGTLDSEGRAVISVPTQAFTDHGSAQVLDLTLNVTVKDAAGRSTEASSDVRIYAGRLTLDLQPDGYLTAPGVPASFAVKVADLTGAPCASWPVELEVLKESAVGEEVRSDHLGMVRGATNALGSAELRFTPRSTGELTIVARTRDADRRLISAMTRVWCVAGAGEGATQDMASLQVHADKRKYRVGDVARLLVNCERAGIAALVTVTGGDRIHSARVVRLTHGASILHVPIAAAYGSTANVSVCAIWRSRYREISTSLTIAAPDRDLRVALTPLPAHTRPRARVRFGVAVTDSRGRPVAAETSLSVVDEAIYQLREDDPSAARDAFYPAEYSTVRTWYSCEDRMYSGDKGQPRIEARRRFEDAPFWAAHVVTDARGRAEVDVPLPDNLTTWRATAIAHSAATQVGRGTATVVATLPFQVTIQAPRFITQTDSLRLSATVANGTSAPHRALVRLTGAALEVGGSAVQAVMLAPNATATATWTVRAPTAGAASVRADAWTTDGSRLADAMLWPIEVRHAGRETTHVFAGALAPSGSVTHRFEAPASPDAAVATIRVAGSPLDAVAPAAQYLATYPYGCTEQTVSALAANMLVRRLPRDAAVGTVSAPAPAGLAPLGDAVRDGITRLRKLQRPDGGWGWFEGDDADPWLTAYALHALADVRRDGFAIQRDMAQEGISAAMKLLNVAGPDDRAFLAFALARHGCDALHRVEVAGLGRGGLACLAMAMRALGRSGSALRSADLNLAQAARKVSGMAYWAGRTASAGSHWNRTATTALALRSLLQSDPGSALVGQAVRYLMTTRSEGMWNSTRDTSLVLAALCEYIAKRPYAPSATTALRVALNGRAIATLRPGQAGGETFVRIDRLALRPGANYIVLTAPTGETPYYSVGIRSRAPAGMDQPMRSADGVSVTRQYDVLRQTVLPFRAAVRTFVPLRGSVEAGQVVRCRLTISAPVETMYVMLTDPVPACFEPNARGDVDAEWSEWYSSSDTRDDRAIFFARRVPPGRHVIDYYLRTQTPGRCLAPPARLEGMYDASLRAETTSDTVTVR